MKKHRLLLFLLCICLLTGCSFEWPASDIEQANEESVPVMDSLGLEPTFDYEVPKSIPNIAVNQLGYLSDEMKVAIFTGKELPSTFSVINLETMQVVYEGTLEKRGNANQEICAYGDFSEVIQAGTYYIESPILGRSYSFQIGEKLYDAVFEELCKQYYYNRCGITLTEDYAGGHMHNACHTKKAILREDPSVTLDVTGGWHQTENGSKMVATAATSAANMLLAYELYGEVFTDAMNIPESGNEIPDILDEIRYEVEWLLKMQNQVNGAVYGGVTMQEATAGDVTGAQAYVEKPTLEATLLFSAVLAKFSYLYQSYDTGYATACLQASDKAYRYAVKKAQELGENVEETAFFAAAELYRATGYPNYHTAVKEYLIQKKYLTSDSENILMGCVTYISTKQNVDVNICSEVMSCIMEKAEQVSAKARQSVYLTEGNAMQDNNGELLHNMMCLTIVDHIITNHEYETVIENHMHYFMGRNAQAICYLDNIGENNYVEVDERMGIMNQFDSTGKLIFMMSEILGMHRQ